MKKFLIIALLAMAAGCRDAGQKAKETINKGGEAIGETATELVEGVTEGVQRTLDSEIELSDALKEKGVSTGKYYIEKDSLGRNNKLVVYIITEKPYQGVLTFKALDKKGVEFGRKQIELNTKAGEADYKDIVFDPRTDIEVKSTIKIE